MNPREKLVFFRHMLTDRRNVGAIFPTGATASRALCSELRRRPGPQRILEVGCGTGPVTGAIVASMSDEDRLTVCDINESFVDYVKRRFATEPAFKRKAHLVDFYAGDITELDQESSFDLIISSIPLTTLTADVLRKVLRHFSLLLKPGGTLTYIEYAYLRDLRETLQPVIKSRHFEEVNSVIKDLLEEYEYRTEVIRWNFLPGVVRSLRFDEAPPEEAFATLPDPEQRRLQVGSHFFAADALPACAALLSAGVFLKLKGKRGASIPLTLAAFNAWRHRDPRRLVLADRELSLAVADGEVVAVHQVRHPRLGEESWIRIRIAVAATDVHINRSPVAGRVTDRWEEPAGYSPGAAGEERASVYLVLETEHGRCAVAQRGGWTGGKIFTWCRQGELLTQGGRFGLLPLGGRADLYLPQGSAEVLVRVGDKVKAGLTPVARFEQ